MPFCFPNSKVTTWAIELSLKLLVCCLTELVSKAFFFFFLSNTVVQTVKSWRWGIKEAFSPVSHSGFRPEAKDGLMLYNLPLECAWIERSILIDASEDSPNQTWDSWDRWAPESDSALNTLCAESGAVREMMEQHWPQLTDDQLSATVKLSKIIDTRYWTDPKYLFPKCTRFSLNLYV